MVASYSSFYRIPFASGAGYREDYERLPVDFGYNEVTRQFQLPAPSGNPEFTLYGSRSSSDQKARYGPLTTVINNPLLQITSQSAERDLTITENVGGKFALPLRDFSGVHSTLTLGFDFKNYRLQSFTTNLSYLSETLTNNGIASTSNNVIALPANSHDDLTYMPLSWGWSAAEPDKWGSTSFSLEQDVFLSPMASSRTNFQATAGARDAEGITPRSCSTPPAKKNSAVIRSLSVPRRRPMVESPSSATSNSRWAAPPASAVSRRAKPTATPDGARPRICAPRPWALGRFR